MGFSTLKGNPEQQLTQDSEVIAEHTQGNGSLAVVPFLLGHESQQDQWKLAADVSALLSHLKGLLCLHALPFKIHTQPSIMPLFRTPKALPFCLTGGHPRKAVCKAVSGIWRAECAAGLEFRELRGLMSELPMEELAVAGHAVALSQWHAVRSLLTS